jgi:tetratricopeptide (TPR) repeat protein
MRPRSVIKLLTLAGLTFVLLLTPGCGVYFNTFFNAKKAFNSAESKRESSKTGTGGEAEYRRAIEKATKVIETSPNSKYYDDALRILAISYFHTKQYSRAERRFRELLSNYPQSGWVKEATLYMAKAKLQLDEIEDANVIFEDIFQKDFPKEYKAESAMALGKYYYDNENYDLSQKYFQAVRDSLGDDIQKLKAQIYVADAQFEVFKFREALGAYLQVLGMNPDVGEKYHATYRAALCSYQLLRIADGMDYLNKLVNDEQYFDSLGILQLTIGTGYEYEDDLAGAEAMYMKVINSTERKPWIADAYYRLGLIYQFQYDDLKTAKSYYDKSVEASRSGEIGLDAVQRSSDIGKLSTYAHKQLDSAATQTAIDDAGYMQYLLGELYWFSLGKPDSAIAEMQYLVDSLPTAYVVPKGLIALAQMRREQLGDTVGADSLLRLVLTRHAGSDYVPEALRLLGLTGSAADTGYAELYIRRAERFVVDDKNIDSARANYQYVVDHFPDSKYNLTARFATIWLKENYQSPGDSSVILAYQMFADSFPGTEFTKEARKRLGQAQSQPKPGDRPAQAEESDTTQQPVDTTALAGSDTTGGYIDPRVALYYRPNGDTLADIKLEPIETVEPFVFPEGASTGDRYDWTLYYQILVDFSGRVIDYELKIPTEVVEINERASITVASMTFDAMEVSNRVVDANLKESPDKRGHWFVYLFKVSKPEHLR